jgi:hypothetical protein
MWCLQNRRNSRKEEGRKVDELRRRKESGRWEGADIYTSGEVKVSEANKCQIRLGST